MTVHLIYECFVFCRAYHYNMYIIHVDLLLNVTVNVRMIMNAHNTMPHSMCMYILHDMAVKIY